jgi:hypothetical protein
VKPPFLLHAACLAGIVLALAAPAAAAPGTNAPELPAGTGSWFAATTWAQRLDWLHDTGNVVSDQNIKRADDWFINDPTNRLPFERPKFRLGLQAEVDFFTNTNKLALRPLIDTGSHVNMPNAAKRLRLTVSTLDPMALPGQDANQGAGGFRVGFSKGMLKDIDTSTGVRIAWPPSVYAHVAWDPRYALGTWDLYPEQKVGWDSSDGAYETTSLIANRWINRWVIRPIASLELSRSRYNDDQAQLEQDRQAAQQAGLPPPDGDYLKGWDWQLTLLSGYAKELLDESVYGRLADCSDVAEGGGFRFSVLGGLHIIESYNFTILYRGNLYKKWIYYLLKPNVSWQSANDWAAEYSLTFGLDFFLYGTKDR